MKYLIFFSLILLACKQKPPMVTDCENPKVDTLYYPGDGYAMRKICGTDTTYLSYPLIDSFKSDVNVSKQLRWDTVKEDILIVKEKSLLLKHYRIRDSARVDTIDHVGRRLDSSFRGLKFAQMHGIYKALRDANEILYLRTENEKYFVLGNKYVDSMEMMYDSAKKYNFVKR